jgi:hypothetical protein
MLKKANAFLDDFEELVREIDVRTLVLQNGLRPHIDFAHYYAIAKCHFEGKEFKN